MTTKTKAKAPKLTLVADLPAGIKVADLTSPKWDSKDPLIEGWDNNTFELWYSSGFEWVIPTLLISRSRTAADRTYAVRVSDGAPVRVGKGPHIKQQLRVYVRKSRVADLQKYLDLRLSGQEKSNLIRDRISSRRAQGALYRMNRGW